MESKEIIKNNEIISSIIQKLWTELSNIRMAIQNVEITKDSDYSWMDDEMSTEEKEKRINISIESSKKRSNKDIENALLGIAKKANEISSIALAMMNNEIEY